MFNQQRLFWPIASPAVLSTVTVRLGSILNLNSADEAY